jgi:hypothetical protein
MANRMSPRHRSVPRAALHAAPHAAASLGRLWRRVRACRSSRYSAMFQFINNIDRRLDP